MVQGVLEKLDLNSDGRITPEELEKWLDNPKSMRKYFVGLAVRE